LTRQQLLPTTPEEEEEEEKEKEEEKEEKPPSPRTLLGLHFLDKYLFVYAGDMSLGWGHLT